MKLKYGIACEGVLPSNVRHIFNEDIINLLPVRDQHGRRILALDAGSK